MRTTLLILMVFFMSASIASAELPLDTYNPAAINPSANYSVIQTQNTLGQNFSGQNSTFCKGATCNYTPLEPIPSDPFSRLGYGGGGGTLATYLNAIFKLLITLGSLFAVVMLVVAGIGYMVSEAAVDIEKAKQRARAALWGLLLLAGCWLVLDTINPDLLKFNLNIPMSPAAPNSYVPGGATQPTNINQAMGNALDDNQQQAALKYTQDNYGGTLLSWIGQHLPSYTTVLGSMPSGSGDINAFTGRCEATTRKLDANVTVRASVKTVPAATTGTPQDTLVCVMP